MLPLPLSRCLLRGHLLLLVTQVMGDLKLSNSTLRKQASRLRNKVMSRTLWPGYWGIGVEILIVLSRRRLLRALWQVPWRGSRRLSGIPQ